MSWSQVAGTCGSVSSQPLLRTCRPVSLHHHHHHCCNTPTQLVGSAVQRQGASQSRTCGALHALGGTRLGRVEPAGALGALDLTRLSIGALHPTGQSPPSHNKTLMREGIHGSVSDCRWTMAWCTQTSSAGSLHPAAAWGRHVAWVGWWGPGARWKHGMFR
jgi:hypothetical protein